MFAPTVYARRRAALRASLSASGLGEGLVLVLGNGESPMNYADNAYPFRQDSTFLYLFGQPVAGMAGTMDIATGRSVLYGETLSLDDEVWTGPLPSLETLGAEAGVDEVRKRAELARDASRRAASLFFVRPYRDAQRLELASISGLPFNKVDEKASIDLMRALVALREIKAPEEIAEMDRAADISACMHRAVIRAARPGMVEAELAAIAAKEALAGGGGLSFPVIATTRGAVLHNHHYDHTLAEGGLFLLDCGAETASGYAGDLTSTFPIGRRYDARQKAVYEIVLAGFAAAASSCRPGRPFIDVHFAAARAMAEGLKGLGIMKGDVEEALAAGAHALFFPHGLGHMIGLDVHDMENYGEVLVGYDGKPKSAQFGLKSLRLGKPLKTGMVHSIEPGLYFIEGLMAAWKTERCHEAFIDYAEAARWIGFGGVRNEEDWLVTETGGRKLGGPFDKSVAAMEALRD